MAQATTELPIDPKSEAIARVYADAFLDSVPAAEAESAVAELEAFIAELQQNQPKFLVLLSSAMLTRDEKVQVLQRSVVPFTSEHLGNFLSVLAKHDRLDLLQEVSQTIRQRHEVRSGRGHVLVRSAVPLSADQKENIQRQLTASLPFQPILDVEVDPSLLGGLIIRVGDTVYDGSLRARLKQLRTQMRERSLHEIQSGRDRFSHSERD